MLAAEGERFDVTIHWPPRSRRLSEILRTGRCPSYAVPRKARRHAVVALVDRSGNVQLLFELSEIKENADVIGANGRRYRNGCILVAKPGTVRKPRRGDPAYLEVNRHAVGAIGYFDARSGEGVLYDPTSRMRAAPTAGGAHGLAPRRRYPFFANNIGKSLSQPERALIRAYVSWVGSEEPFEHHYLPGPGLYTDLFYRPRWVLVEAKISVSREILRAAMGQVMDYQRYYTRHPRLALLLPERPSDTMLDLLSSKRVATVWRSRSASFKDSVEGALTSQLRSSIAQGST